MKSSVQSNSPGRTSLSRILLQNVVFCTIIAIVLWQLVPGVGQYGFWINLIYSQAIGNSICLLAIAVSIAFEDKIERNKALRIITFIGIAILGAATGQALATWIISFFVESTEPAFEVNNLLATGFIAIAASIIFTSFQRHRQNLLTLKLEASEESRRADNARHAMLQAQLEPHMLFNTLANLRVLISTDKNKAIDMLDRLDSFLKETLSASQTRNQPLSHEFNVLEDYLELMKVRFGDRLQFTLQLDANCEHVSVPTMLLQPLVENAIKHGIEPQIEGGSIHVTAHCTGANTILNVSDTGVGFDAQHDNPSLAAKDTLSISSGGFGLTNIKERIAQSYGDKATIKIDTNNSDDNKGTSITLTLPVNTIEASS